MKTYSTKASEIKREWHIIDASDEVLGRMATRAAGLLMGKHKATFCRHLDTGDYVVIINAAKVRTTGNKLKQKIYYSHSGYPGGLKAINLEAMLKKDPSKVIAHAVKGMLPHNRLEATMMKRLRVYSGDEHPHLGQLNKAPSGMAGPASEE